MFTIHLCNVMVHSIENAIIANDMQMIIEKKNQFV